MRFRINYCNILILLVLCFFSFNDKVNAAVCPVDPTYGTFRWGIESGNTQSMDSLITDYVRDFSYNVAWVKDTSTEKIVSFVYAGYVYIARNGLYPPSDGANGTWKIGTGLAVLSGSERFQPGLSYTLQAPVQIPGGVQTYLTGKKVSKATITYISKSVFDMLFNAGSSLNGTAYGASLLNSNGTISSSSPLIYKNNVAAQNLINYSVLGSSIDLQIGWYDDVALSSLNVVYGISNLRSNFVNSGKPGELASGMGRNLKYYSWDPNCVEAAKGDKTMAMVMYMPFLVNFYFEDACDYKAATNNNTSTNPKFKDYWSLSGKYTSSKTKYTPTQMMMDCTCGENATANFKKWIDNKYGASLLKAITSKYLYKINCDDYTTRKECTIANYNAGYLTRDEVQACCDAGVPGFDGEVCPQDTVFELWCDDHLTGSDGNGGEIQTKTYISYEDEMDGKNNRACSIFCTETGTALFEDSPYVIAGQWFDYSWEFDSKRSCVATYKYTPSAWEDTFNDKVDDRIDAYTEYKLWVDTRDPYTSDEPPCPCTDWDTYDCGTELKPKTCKTCVAYGPCTVSDTPTGGTLRIGSYDNKVKSLKNIWNNKYNDEQDFLDDKLKCDNWKNSYSLNSDFSIEIEEGTKTTSYKMREDLEKDYESVLDGSVSKTAAIAIKTSCSKTALSCSTHPSFAYDIYWTKNTAYEATYTLPEYYYIDRVTHAITTEEPNYFYDGGYVYFTSLGTYTGTYSLRITMGNTYDGFGAYEEFTLKNNEMVCWYDLSNEYSSDEDDDNHPKYGNLGFVFRVVDLYDLFPGREPGSNWKEADSLVHKIESLGTTIYEDETPFYTFVMTPDDMSTIRAYNDKHPYSEWYNFDFGDPDSKEGTSGFLDEITKYVSAYDAATATERSTGK